MNLNDLNRINEQQIRLAGPRYGPGHDPSAPNLAIASVVETLDALTYAAEFRQRINELKVNLAEAWTHAPASVQKLFRGRIRTPSSLVAQLEALGRAGPSTTEVILRPLDQITKTVQGVLGRASSALLETQRNAQTDEERRSISSKLSDLRTLDRGLSPLADFLRSAARLSLTYNNVLLVGEWGTGKTHLLCDITRHRVDAGLPTLLFLAQNLPGSGDPLDALCRATGLARDRREFLAELQALGLTHGGRALLIIDGINEGNRASWQRSVSGLIRDVASLPHVGLVLSCRDPFQELIFTRRTRKRLVEIRHPGFADREFDAQIEFFSHYGIPAPAFPLIAPEFSRPLFLKLLCEAIQSLSSAAKHRTLKDIASGQKGMTYVLEHFVKELGRRIEDEFGLARKSCWYVLKGVDSAGGGNLGLAGAMATDGCDYLSPERCVDEIRLATQLSVRQAQRLLRRMVTDGILAEGVQRNAERQTSEEVVRFPYQRFSDHLIARHLLARHLSVSSPASVRQSFYKNRPLGRVFELTNGDWSFVQPGLAAAIMLEFPERVKRVVPVEERELAFYLPRRVRLARPMKDVFLGGLSWRSVDSFSEQTEKVVNFYLGQSYWRNDVLETLMILAARPGHPYSAQRLHRFVASMEMADRDVFWSEFLRTMPLDGTCYRLIAWIERNRHHAISEVVCSNACLLLGLVLTTTNRSLRDRATRALFFLGTQAPKILFNETLALLNFNDPYVPERMLAASYGVAMNLWHDPRGMSLRAELPAFGKLLTREMFVAGAPRATTHALMRDYALGLIELARKVKPRCIPARHVAFLKSPFSHIPSPFRVATDVLDSQVADTKDALYMDFNNYTLGRLVTGRSNYDSGHTEYQDVRRQILGRMADLGYSYRRFEQLDREIARLAPLTRAPEPDKVDRYGKKYSWIAFFEMYGIREAQGGLSSWRLGSRTSDCDLDPSFPEPAKQWLPELPTVFEEPYGSAREWLEGGPTPQYEHLFERSEVDGHRGQWVLLDGLVFQGATNDPREIFTFLRGVIVSRRIVERFRRRLMNTPYPGNDGIPEPRSDTYTYAGEIPWRHTFGEDSRSARGRALTQIGFALDEFRDGEWTQDIPVEIPAYGFGWETYHSTMNQVSGMEFPAPRLCEELDLVNHSGTTDLFEATGRQATIYREFKVRPSSPTFGTSHLLYLRKDLLDRYLAKLGKVLVWVPWGERTLTYDEFRRRDDEVNALRGDHAHIHKGLAIYSGSR